MKKTVGILLIILIGALQLEAGIFKSLLRFRIQRVPVIHFSGYDWEVKSSDVPVAPRDNYFAADSANVEVDSTGKLHLRITHREAIWYCAEIRSRKSFGYGDYIFQLGSAVDSLPVDVVLGLFTYDSKAEPPHREIDIEFARWGDIQNPNAQYVVQPYTEEGNLERFHIRLDGSYTTHRFRWYPEGIHFESYNGNYPFAPGKEHFQKMWLYRAADVPSEGRERVHLNLYLISEKRLSKDEVIEVIINRFLFIPFGRSNPIN